MADSQRHVWWRRARLVGGTLLTTLGLVDVPDNLQKWQQVVALVASHFEHLSQRDLLFLGIGGLLLLSAVPWGRVARWRGVSEPVHGLPWVPDPWPPPPALIPSGSGLSGLLPAVEPIPDHPEDVVVSGTLETVTRPYRELTSLQAPPSKVFLGKWIEVDGRLFDCEVSADTVTVFLSPDGDGAMALFMCHAEFDRSPWEDKLNHIPKGDRIKLKGQITRIDGASAFLRRCKLLSNASRDASAPHSN